MLFKRNIARFLVVLVVVLLATTTTTSSFICPSSLVPSTAAAAVRSVTTTLLPPSHTTTTSTSTTSTQLSERRWNFNEGRSPWGLKKNAEIWNGRLAQMAFVVVFGQELITGKGVIAGLQEGDPINIALLAVAVLSTVGLTAWLAIQGTDEYVDQV